jgi:hypothetical protein
MARLILAALLLLAPAARAVQLHFEAWPSTPPFEPGQREAAPISVRGTGDALEALARWGGGEGFIRFLPEPASPPLLLGVLFAVLVSRHLRGSNTQL